MLKTVVLINTIQDLSWLSSFCRGAPGEHLCFKEYSAAFCIKEDHNIIVLKVWIHKIPCIALNRDNIWVKQVEEAEEVHKIWHKMSWESFVRKYLHVPSRCLGQVMLFAFGMSFLRIPVSWRWWHWIGLLSGQWPQIQSCWRSWTQSQWVIKHFYQSSFILLFRCSIEWSLQPVKKKKRKVGLLLQYMSMPNLYH